MKRPEWKEYHLTGVVEGTIWMPASKCWKEFSKWFSDQAQKPFRREWEGLEKAIDHIENDGDFQSCSVVILDITVLYHYKNKTVTRSKTIRYSPEVYNIEE